jgi:hypothetical protein
MVLVVPDVDKKLTFLRRCSKLPPSAAIKARSRSSLVRSAHVSSQFVLRHTAEQGSTLSIEEMIHG